MWGGPVATAKPETPGPRCLINCGRYNLEASIGLSTLTDAELSLLVKLVESGRLRATPDAVPDTETEIDGVVQAAGGRTMSGETEAASTGPEQAPAARTMPAVRREGVIAIGAAALGVLAPGALRSIG